MSKPVTERRWTDGIGPAILVLVAVVVVGTVWVAAARAGGVGVWTSVTGKTGTNLTQVDAAKRPDGKLAVVWVRRTPSASTQDVMLRTISAGGTNGALQSVQSSWATLNNPAYLLSTDLSLEGVFYGGIRSIAPGEVHDGLSFSWSTFAAPGWSLTPTIIDDQTSGSNAYASDVEAVATNGPDGYYFTWFGSSGVWVHATTSDAAPNFSFNAGLGGFGYYSSLGYDNASNLVWVAWASNATTNSGVWASVVNQATGAPAGIRVRLPNSATLWGGSQQFAMMLSKVPITGRPTGEGVYVAYPTGYPTPTVVRLWKLVPRAVDSRMLIVAGGAAAKRQTAVAAAPDGRVWVVWSQTQGSRSKIFVRRSNTSVTQFGPVKSLVTPPGYSTVWHLAAVVRNGRLDVLAHASGSKPAATLHVQFKPPT